jgi:hypothetical protein
VVGDSNRVFGHFGCFVGVVVGFEARFGFWCFVYPWVVFGCMGLFSTALYLRLGL